jgi:hypothetical protein
MKINLVEDWKQAHKWLSVKIPVIGSALLGSYVVLPAELKAAIPHWAVVAAAITFLLGGAVGRVVDQTPKAPDGE